MIRAILIFILCITLAYSHDTDKNNKGTDNAKADAVSYTEYYMRYEPMFNQLKKGIGILGDNMEFVLINDNSIVNAFASTDSGKKEVILMTGFIEFFKSKVSTNDLDEIIAEVLAHEIAHIALGHTKTGKGSEPTTEIEADLFAIRLLVATGLPCTGGYKGMELLVDGRTEFTTHPPAYFRVIYLKAMCEREMKKYE